MHITDYESVTVHCHNSEEVCKVVKRLNIVDPERTITVQVNGRQKKKVSIAKWEEKCQIDLTTDYAKQPVICCPPICTSKYSAILLNIIESFENRQKGEQIWLFSNN